MSTSSSTPARRTAAAVGRKPVDADAVLGRTDPDGAASGRVGLGRRGHGRQSLSGRRRVRAVEPVRLGRRPRVVGRCRRLEVDQDGSAEVTRTGPRRTSSSKCPRTPRVRSLAVPDQFLLEVPLNSSCPLSGRNSPNRFILEVSPQRTLRTLAPAAVLLEVPSNSSCPSTARSRHRLWHGPLLSVSFRPVFPEFLLDGRSVQLPPRSPRKCPELIVPAPTHFTPVLPRSMPVPDTGARPGPPPSATTPLACSETA